MSIDEYSDSDLQERASATGPSKLAGTWLAMVVSALVLLFAHWLSSAS